MLRGWFHRSIYQNLRKYGGMKKGTLFYRFLERDGAAQDIRIVKPLIHTVLDRAAVDAVKRASPLDVPPVFFVMRIYILRCRCGHQLQPSIGFDVSHRFLLALRFFCGAH